jgi:hypothetical protein
MRIDQQLLEGTPIGHTRERTAFAHRELATPAIVRDRRGFRWRQRAPGGGCPAQQSREAQQVFRFSATPQSLDEGQAAVPCKQECERKYGLAGPGL